MLTRPSLLLPSSYASLVIGMAPVQYWRLLEGGGTRAFDERRLENGVYIGSPAMALGGPPGIPDGGAVKCAVGGGTWVEAGTQAIPQAAYTLACWAYLTSSATDKGIFGQWQNGPGSMIWRGSSTNASLHHQNTDVSAAVSRNIWHHLAGTWSGTELRFYVDGVLKAGPTANSTAPGQTAGTKWTIGSYTVGGTPSTRIMDGHFSEAAYWSRALTAGEIAALAAPGLGG